MRILILSVGDRRLLFFMGGRSECSGPAACLGAIFVLFFRKLQLELKSHFASHTVFKTFGAISKTEQKPSGAFR
ncbi:hypothetical protein [Rhizobium sp. BK602]|uniref:hypothetical protein n=1 Tax=Rhizobium sp. BK602 TaxID=2586986 RepID=UPI0016087AAE|nr:hypothetical protein [Rhizobium sp. BK602]MBB3607662.1 hypothetical protein [Rhizobium sp. BK602]